MGCKIPGDRLSGVNVLGLVILNASSGWFEGLPWAILENHKMS
jgi:hypothetical protein